MDLYSQTIKLCEENDIKPARSKGQNFLIEEDVFDRIVENSDLNKDDTVLEVGPGFGFLTEKLAKKVKKVIAVELDDKLAEVLRIRLKENNIENVVVINENILDLDIDTLSLRRSGPGEVIDDYKIVANLPYNITSVFLRKFLTIAHKPTSLTLMLQKEVAERIVAKNGKMSLLAVSVQFYAQAEILFNVSASFFYPAPKVDSAVIKIDLFKSSFASFSCHSRRADEKEENLLKDKDFFRLVKHGFSSKRKMLKKNLAGGFCLPVAEIVAKIQKVGLSEKIRAEELSVDNWVDLLREF